MRSQPELVLQRFLDRSKPERRHTFHSHVVVAMLCAIGALLVHLVERGCVVEYDWLG